MRKSSSAILLATLIAFTNCKSDAGKTTSKDDTVNKFYQSIIKLGNGFIDVFSSFGGLITDILGFKADPKKSDVKNYFDAIAKKLEETAKSLEKLTKDNEDIVENTVESAVKGTSGWLKEMIDAAKKAGEKSGGGVDSIGNVADAGNNGAQGNAGSVKAIAGGMKGIVDAAKKAGEKSGGAGESIGNVATAGNNGAQGDAGSVKAIAGGMKGIVDAAKKAGEKSSGGGESIGNVADAGNNGAKGDAGSVKAIAGGMKGIVDAAKKAGVELKVDAGAGDGNENAGKLFNVGGHDGANDEAIGKAADAVSKVSGKQILHAIVTSGGGNGAKASKATNPIDAAIGGADDDNNAFGDNMQKNDAIAAALVLRGMAKGGKFALAGAANGQKSLKNAVESAVTGTSGWLKEMIDAAKKAGEKNGGGGESIGNVADANNNGAQGNAGSVKAIAGGMKGIVDAAKKAGVELKVDAGGGNENAGKLFNVGGRGNANDAAIGKAADAVSKVSGKQILHAIVTSGDGNGARASAATNPIDAAIGAADDDADGAFTGNNMKKNDAIAAALVLRGMAKDGKFALANGANGQKSLKNAVESAVTGTSGWLKEMIDAAKKAGEKNGGGGESIGNVAAANNNGAQGNAGSVKAIAGGMKGIVDAAKKAGVELKVDGDAGGGGAENADAGKLFNAGGNNGADDAAIGKAADAVSKVSGKQILHAIVTSGDGDGAKASEATNPIDAAIGAADDDDNAFGDNMQKNDAIAAALVLRGMAKDGKFALAIGANGQKSLKNAVESAVTGTSGWLKEMIDAAKKAGEKSGDAGESIGNVATAGNNGAQGNADSVKAIAGGMKGIVDAAKKAGVELKVDGDGGAGNADAGKLFNAGGRNGAGADDAAIGKAADAVSKVSGKQILHAIVTSGDGGGAKASAATNPIDAAIGADDNDAAGAFTGNMQKNDAIAAALVLRGMAKDGKFALAAGAANGQKSLKNAVESAVTGTSGWLKEMIDAAKKAGEKSGGGGESIGNVATAGNNGAKGDADSVKAIAGGMKGIVDAAKKAGVELKVDAGGGAENADADAGKLFNMGGNDNANDAAIGKAADAVSKVSGKQILHAIVTSGDGGNGAKASEATNPIDAAIGAADDDNANGAFGVDNMKKNDAIAAALVLRGMAKGGKFALDGAANGQKSLKNAVESAVTGTSGWLKEMIDAAKKAGEKSGGGGESIGNVAAADNNGAKGDADSVKAIAGGMKGIVDAAKKAGVELKVDGDAGGGAAENADAGKLFNAGGHDGANDEAIGKAADAVSKVSGKQILHAIVTSGDGGGAKASAATNPIDAAIGATDNDANGAFGGNMQKNDAIAAALVLRGMAKGGKFALAIGANGTSLKNAVESAVTKTVGALTEIIGEAVRSGLKGIGDAVKKQVRRMVMLVKALETLLLLVIMAHKGTLAVLRRLLVE
ncbi:variable large family protein (plasmid) [Borreliella americana]|uniref:Variable large family protein n=1 Tax=Borreliella americana TaxID=478807 RepID=A0ACD5G6S0_9SPIR